MPARLEKSGCAGFLFFEKHHERAVGEKEVTERKEKEKGSGKGAEAGGYLSE